MKKKKHNPEVYMVDVFYEKNKSRVKPEENESKAEKSVGVVLKVIMILAALILAAVLLPGKLIKPFENETGSSLLINSAPDAEPLEDDGSVPDESLWRENISPIDIENKIYLAWDDPVRTLTELPPNVNILAPCWFKLKENTDGTGVDLIASDISKDAYNYVEFCHNGGVDVWGTVQCFNYDLSEIIVKDATQRQLLINQILLWISTYDLDGINIDFEDMNPDSKQLFINFCQELKTAMPEGMPLSVAVTVKLVSESAATNTWQAYDRGGIAQVVDYITVMTYDEHKSSTKKPVASIEWVDLHIRRLLEEIPSEKLVMGIPFHGVDYRAEVVNAETLTLNPLWKSSGVTATVFELNKLLEFGEYADRYGSDSQKTIVLDYWISRGSWVADLGISNYSFVDTDGIQHSIWIDDENSIYQKARLANDYNLAGVAIWKKSLGTEPMFEAVARANQD